MVKNMYNKLVGGQCTIYNKTSCWKLQNSGHWCTQLYFKMYTINGKERQVNLTVN